MKYRVIELEGALLDAAVAKAEGARLGPGFMEWPDTHPKAGELIATFWRPSSEWQDGGPILERERIELSITSLELGRRWRAVASCFAGAVCLGETPLIAAMRAYVASKFGEEIEL